MKTRTVTFVALALPLLANLAVAGQPPGGSRPPAAIRDPGVNVHQHRQQHRIQQGARSGELTRGETRELRSEQRDIRQMERDYKSDGTLTRQERKELHQAQHEASRNIYDEKHDGDKRPRAR